MPSHRTDSGGQRGGARSEGWEAAGFQWKMAFLLNSATYS